ncbi:MAG: hypothetical protein WBX15_06390, partial [Thermoanaerobaculia bacterium]
ENRRPDPDLVPAYNRESKAWPRSCSKKHVASSAEFFFFRFDPELLPKAIANPGLAVLPAELLS